MANTLFASINCASGGLTEFVSTQGTPSVQATTKNSGSYALQCDGSATQNAATKSTAAWTVGNFTTTLAVVQFSSLSPSTAYDFLKIDSNDQAAIGPAEAGVCLRLDTNGDIIILSQSSGATATLTAANHGMSTSTWETIRIDCEHHGTTGRAKVTINGNSAEITSTDTSRNSANPGMGFGGAGSGDGTCYLDVVVVWETGGVYGPTDLPSTIKKSGVYQSDDTTTQDLGDVTTSGTWANVSELPFSATNLISMDAQPHEIGSDCDGGSRAGPSGDTDLDGATIAGGVVVFYGKPGGAGYAYNIYGGSNNDTWPTGLNSEGFVDAKVVVYHDSYLTGATVAPTTSEYLRFGVYHNEAKKLEVYELAGVIFYSSATTSIFSINELAYGSISSVNEVSKANMASWNGVT